jgi:hypothetical protein
MAGLQVDVINSNEVSMKVIVEPWAREYDVPAGTTAQFDFDGPEPIHIEVEASPDTLVIYSWVGSILVDGIHPIGLPVPPTPVRRSGG